MDSHQSAYDPFPSDVSGDQGGGFIIDDDDEGSSEVKARRMNIANEMWESYLEYTADDDDTFSSEGQYIFLFSLSLWTPYQVNNNNISGELPYSPGILMNTG